MRPADKRRDESSPAILVTGGTGQIGYELVRELAPLGRIVAPSREELDITDLARIESYIEELDPIAVVNAAAYTAVDRAESERALAFRVNADAPEALAGAAQRCGAVFVHYSTDYVFDGTSEVPYSEESVAAPLNVYGESKLAGENRVSAVGGRYLVLRTSWVYGMRGANFMRTILRKAREVEELRVVADQIGAPTWSRMIAGATATMLAQCLPLKPDDDRFGVYHLTAAGHTTWYDFARAILAADPNASEQRCKQIIPIPTLEFSTPARRPAHSVLSNAKLHRRFGIALPPWEEQLKLSLQRRPSDTVRSCGQG